MKDQKRFTELLRDFRSNVLLFESTLLKLESLERAWEEGSLSERYSEETVKQAISDLYDEVSWIGRDVSNRVTESCPPNARWKRRFAGYSRRCRHRNP